MSALSLGGFAVSMVRDALSTGHIRVQNSVIRYADQPRLFWTAVIVVAVATSGLQAEVKGPLAAKLSGVSDAREASFAVMPTGVNEFTAWSWRRTLPFEFASSGRKVRSLKVGGLELKR